MTSKRPYLTIADRSLVIALALLMVTSTRCGPAESEPIATTAPATTAAAATTAAVTPATAEPDTTTTTRPASTLVWGPCGSAECATLTVPLDHGDPSLGTFDLAVARLPTERPDDRIGVLLYNPGGPGVPGVPMVTDWVDEVFSGELLRRFDVVSWDPRGVSAGTEIDCVDDPDRILALDPTPETAEEAALIDAQVREFAAGCAERSGDVLPYLSTVSTARDMDLLRSVG